MNFRLPHTVTYWAPSTRDQYNVLSFADPVQLDCRWQSAAKLFRDVDGVQQVSDAVIYLDQVVVREGWLYLGTSAVADPKTVDGAHEIRQINSSDDLAGTQTLYKAFV